MVSDIILITLGAWVHQAIRVAVLLFRQPKALRRATPPDRLIAVNPFSASAWSKASNEADRIQLDQFKKRFFWEFYVFLLGPTVVLIGWVVSR